MAMHGPDSDNPLPVLTTRSWMTRDGDQTCEHRLGFDIAGCPVRYEVRGPEQGRRSLDLAWRTASGEWLGQYRCATGHAIARLSPDEVDFIEIATKVVTFG
jgi:hypothetical protein